MRGYSCYFIKKLPDLILSKYQALSESNVEGLLLLETVFLRQWVAICDLYNLTLHLLITYNHGKPNGKRLDICIAFCGAQSGLHAVNQLLGGSSLREYFALKKDEKDEAQIKKLKFEYACTLIKRERRLISQESSKFSQTQKEIAHCFVSAWEMNEGARLVDMIRMMESLPCDSAYRVDIFPAPLGEITRLEFTKIIPALKARASSYDSDRVTLGTQRQSFKSDHNAEDALKQYEDWISKIETTPHFRANIYAFGNEKVQHAKLLLHSAASEALEKGEYTVLDISYSANKANVNSRMLAAEEFPVFSVQSSVENKPGTTCFPTRFGAFQGFPFEGVTRAVPFTSKDFPKNISFWPTTFTHEEMSAFFRLPALYEGEVIQLPKETAVDPEMEGLLLGEDTSKHKVYFPLANLNKHAFICGVPGSGKTNTMLHLTSTLWKKFRIPFLVFEPAKKEYRALFNDPEMRDALLFSPTAGTTLPISINPFQFPRGLTLSEHIAALMQVFSGAFEVIGAVRFYLNKAIEEAYYALGWEEDTINDGMLDYPILTDIIERYAVGVESSSYDGELKGNLTSFLQVRLGGLMTRELNEIFNTADSSLPPEKWLEKPVIVELESLEREACNFFILLLCTLIRETLKASPGTKTAHKLRHVIFIEEAHNLIAPQTEQQSADSVDPKISATAYIVKMLAEVRALNEGIVIADQLPSAIASEVMKNTSLKIVHRMTAEDDRGMVGSTMSATGAQLEHLGTYRPGEALVFYEGLQLPFRGEIEKWAAAKEDNSKYTPKDIAELTAMMMENEGYRKTLNNFVSGQMLKFLKFFEKIEIIHGQVEDSLEELKEEAGKITSDMEAGMNVIDRLKDLLESYKKLEEEKIRQHEDEVLKESKAVRKLNSRFPQAAVDIEEERINTLAKHEALKNILKEYSEALSEALEIHSAEIEAEKNGT